MVIYQVYKDLDDEYEFFQFEVDAKQAAKEYLQEVSDDEGWGIEELRAAECELDELNACDGIVYIKEVELR